MQTLPQELILCICDFCASVNTIYSLQRTCKMLHHCTKDLNLSCPLFSFLIDVPKNDEQLQHLRILVNDKRFNNNKNCKLEEEIFFPANSKQRVHIRWAFVVDEQYEQNVNDSEVGYYSAWYSYNPASWQTRQMELHFTKLDLLNQVNGQAFVDYVQGKPLVLDLDDEIPIPWTIYLEMMGWFSMPASKRKLVAKQVIGTQQNDWQYYKGAPVHLVKGETSNTPSDWVKYSQTLLQHKKEDCDLDLQSHQVVVWQTQKQKMFLGQTKFGHRYKLQYQFPFRRGDQRTMQMVEQRPLKMKLARMFNKYGNCCMGICCGCWVPCLAAYICHAFCLACNEEQ